VLIMQKLSGRSMTLIKETLDVRGGIYAVNTPAQDMNNGSVTYATFRSSTRGLAGWPHTTVNRSTPEETAAASNS
jgi:hypothetical protein